MNSIDILHVDDDPDFADLVQSYLHNENEQFNVVTATSPADGLDILTERDIYCVVSDYDMPRTNGLEFLDLVHQEKPDIPFILFTGKGSEEIASEAITAGVTDYIRKGGTEQYTVLAHRIDNAVEQYRATVTAERTKRRLRELAEKTDDLLWMYSADWDELLFVNSAYEDVLGRSVEKLRNNPRDFLNAVHPDDRDRVKDVMERVSNGQSQEIEYRVNEGDDFSRWVSVKVEPILDADGAVERIVGYSHEITERKKRQRRFEAIFDNTYQFTGLLEPDGTLLEANDAFLSFSGVSREAVVGRQLWQSTWFEENESARHTAQEAVERARDGTPFRSRLRIQGAEQEAIIDFSVRPITDEQEGVSLLVLEGRDITERKEQVFIEQALDTLTDVFYVVNPDGTLDRWNERLEEVTGYYSDEIESMQATEFFPETHQDRIADAINTTFETGEVEVEADFLTKGGERIPHEFTGARITDTDGNPSGLVGVGRDLTDHRQRTQELERKEQRYQAVFEDPNILVALLDTNGTVHQVNDTAMGYVDVDQNDVTGQLFWETPWWSHSTDLQENLREWIERAADGEYVEYECDHSESGEHLFTVHGMIRPVTNTDGNVVSLIASAQDITAQKERERELERYEALTQQSSDILTVIDEAGVIQYQSSSIESVLGYEQAALVGRLAFEYIHPEDRDNVRDRFAKLIGRSGASTERVTYRMQHADGSWRWIESIGKNQMDTELDGYTITSRDITEHKQREAKLEHKNEQLEEFARIVSHDLRNPLNVLVGSLELAQETGEMDHLETCEQAVHRMDQLIDDLLSLAQQGKQIESVESADLDQVAKTCWETVETKDATLAIETDQIVEADRSRLRQLLENLVRNAIDHGGDGITLTVGDLEDGFYVADDGSGFEIEDIETVLESGFSTDSDGTGLGLAIVQEIVSAHGWDIRVSESKSGGARFDITGIED